MTPIRKYSVSFMLKGSDKFLSEDFKLRETAEAYLKMLREDEAVEAAYLWEEDWKLLQVRKIG